MLIVALELLTLALLISILKQESLFFVQPEVILKVYLALELLL